MTRLIITFILLVMVGNSQAANYTTYYSSLASAQAACNAIISGGTCVTTNPSTVTATICLTSSGASVLRAFTAADQHTRTFVACTSGWKACSITGQTRKDGDGQCYCPPGQSVYNGACVVIPPDNCPSPLVKTGNLCKGQITAVDCPASLLANVEAGFHWDANSMTCRGGQVGNAPTCPSGQINMITTTDADACTTASSCVAPNVLWESGTKQVCKQHGTTGVVNVDGSIDPLPDASPAQAATAANEAANAKTQADSAATAKASEAAAAKAASDAAQAAATAAGGSSQQLATANDAAQKLSDYTKAQARAQNAEAAKNVTNIWNDFTQILNQLVIDNSISGNYGQAGHYAGEAVRSSNKAKESAGNAIAGQGTSQGTGGDGQQIEIPTDYVKESTGQGIKGAVDGLKDSFDKNTSNYSGEPSGTPTIAATNQALTDALKQRFTLPTLGAITAECPTFTKTIPLLNVELTIDQFCTLEPEIRPFIESAANVMWSIMGLLILLGA